jgi:sugar/nucleoside kinase (ribokinase family)
MPMRGLFVGLATLDLVQRVARRPGVNEKVVAHRSDLAAGGPAAVAAVTFGALGGHSVLLSALGRGPVGRLAAAELHRAGVHIMDSWAAGADLSISAITVLEGTGERSVVSRNAGDLTAVVPAELPALVRDADVVLIDGHHPGLAVAAAQAAYAARVPVLLDCGSPKPVYAELVPFADAVVCSAAFVAGGPERSDPGRPDPSKSDPSKSDPGRFDPGRFDTVSAELLAEGARLVAMTAGAAPLRWRTLQATGSIDVPPVTVLDTLGAGDVLHGALAFARARGVIDPERSLRFGVVVASLRVQHIGPRAWLDDPRLRTVVTHWQDRDGAPP